MKFVLIIIIVTIIIFLIYNHCKTNNILGFANMNIPGFANKKILRYFGADYCPHSNIDSNAYHVIKDFEDKYGNEVEIIYTWSEKNPDEMAKYNVMYVPTIMNGNNQEIQIKLPENINKETLTPEKLKNILLNTIYTKL